MLHPKNRGYVNNTLVFDYVMKAHLRQYNTSRRHYLGLLPINELWANVIGRYPAIVTRKTHREFSVKKRGVVESLSEL